MWSIVGRLVDKVRLDNGDATDAFIWTNADLLSIGPLGTNLTKYSMSKWQHMASESLFNTGWGYGLLSDGTKLLSEPMLTYHDSSVTSCGIHLRALS